MRHFAKPLRKGLLPHSGKRAGIVFAALEQHGRRRYDGTCIGGRRGDNGNPGDRRDGEAGDEREPRAAFADPLRRKPRRPAMGGNGRPHDQHERRQHFQIVRGEQVRSRDGRLGDGPVERIVEHADVTKLPIVASDRSWIKSNSVAAARTGDHERRRQARRRRRETTSNSAGTRAHAIVTSSRIRHSRSK